MSDKFSPVYFLNSKLLSHLTHHFSDFFSMRARFFNLQLDEKGASQKKFFDLVCKDELNEFFVDKKRGFIFADRALCSYLANVMMKEPEESVCEDELLLSFMQSLIGSSVCNFYNSSFSSDPFLVKLTDRVDVNLDYETYVLVCFSMANDDVNYGQVQILFPMIDLGVL